MERKKKEIPVTHAVGDEVYDFKMKRRGVIRKVDPSSVYMRYLVRYKDGTLKWTDGREWTKKAPPPDET
jgi:hypothetical protein